MTDSCCVRSDCRGARDTDVFRLNFGEAFAPLPSLFFFLALGAGEAAGDFIWVIPHYVVGLLLFAFIAYLIVTPYQNRVSR